jgi:lysophospholipase L1-like esterase
VHYPVTVDYQKAGVSMNAIELQELEEQYRKLPLVAHLDYYHVFDRQQNYFRDPDHLNAHGAPVFSQMLMKDLRNILK